MGSMLYADEIRRNNSQHCRKFQRMAPSHSYLRLIQGWVNHWSPKLYETYQVLKARRHPLEEDAAKSVKANLQEAAKYTVQQMDDYEYAVSNPMQEQEQRIVQINEQSCSCGAYAEFKLPCVHIASFCHPSYTMDSLMRLYSNRIHMIDMNHLIRNALHRAPPYVRRAGRPKTKRIRGATEGSQRMRRKISAPTNSNASNVTSWNQ